MNPNHSSPCYSPSSPPPNPPLSPTTPPIPSSSSSPSVGALLFELREMNNLGTLHKFRYAQTRDDTEKQVRVLSWRSVQKRKGQLKVAHQQAWRTEEEKRLQKERGEIELKRKHWAIKEKETRTTDRIFLFKGEKRERKEKAFFRLVYEGGEGRVV